jgi:hypothetical protein
MLRQLAFSSEEHFTLYWKDIGTGLAWAFGPELFKGLHGRANRCY